MSVNVSQLKILIVDDYKTMLKIISNLLKQLGFQHIEEATDGTMAIEKLNSGSFDLIISDWNMEPMNGLDLLKHVRHDAKLKDLPFIMVTAESKVENVVIAKQAGVSNYIVKPFNAQTLKSKMITVLGNF